MNLRYFRQTFLVLLVLTILACGQQERVIDIEIGTTAPDFKAKTLDRNPFQLKDLKGKYVLLDFWGSWCAPCRKEHPELVDIYQQFSQQDFAEADGFEIVSIAIETDSSSWQKAIKKDQLPWPYLIMEQTKRLDKVSGLISQTYKIIKVPARFLINEKGVIIGINPSPEAVRTFLNTK